ncbi:thioesterase family protein [Halotalea alkalilenta]|uniref:4-hydroxybenzoyl-CoA thioesterase n=1 Tax=Halotalea alkalilenta TaxID=376489 RepID=A0A172YGC2_9GAMM|nr:thioesterase family protein [Halotalea alkalilenta]ANF58264.1 hypothetical protein A5892_12950 [Halotalea alkalilenta]
MTRPWSAPCYVGEVDQAWVDYNGHMRDAFYLLPMSMASDEMMNRIGLDERGRSLLGHTLYTLEAHLHFLAEARLGARIEVGSRLVEHDAKRLRLCHLMYLGAERRLCAASEQLLINIDVASGRSTPFADRVVARIDHGIDAAEALEWRQWAGQRIALKK